MVETYGSWKVISQSSIPPGNIILAAMIEYVIAAFLISDGVVTFITFQLKRKIGGNNLWDMI